MVEAPSSAALTSEVLRCRSPADLVALFESHRSALNSIHCDAMLRALARMLNSRGVEVHQGKSGLGTGLPQSGYRVLRCTAPGPA